LRRFAQLSSADAVYMANRETTYNRKVSAPPLDCNLHPSAVTAVRGLLSQGLDVPEPIHV
jgi:hypothetical protein